MTSPLSDIVAEIGQQTHQLGSFGATGIHDKALLELDQDPRFLIKQLIDFSEAFSFQEVAHLNQSYRDKDESAIKELLFSRFMTLVEEQF